MDELKEFILSRMEELHLKIYYNKKKPYKNTEDGMFEKIKDIVKYEQLKEVIRKNPEWDNEELGKELASRINSKTSL